MSVPRATWVIQEEKEGKRLGTVLDNQEYFGVHEYIIIYNTQIIGTKVKALPSDGCLYQESQRTQSMGANANESAIKVHKVTSTSSTLPLPSLLRLYSLK